MGMNLVITDAGVENSIYAQVEKGFNILISGFSVSDIAGDLDPARTTVNTEWYSGPLGSGNRLTQNSVQLKFNIPALVTTEDMHIRELYVWAEDSLGTPYLFAIAQPSTTKLYTPSSNLIFNIQLTMNNINIGDIYQYVFTQATEIETHNTDPNAHPLFLERMEQVGSFAQESDREYVGQTIDQFALPLIVHSEVSNLKVVYKDAVEGQYMLAINDNSTKSVLSGIYIEDRNMVVNHGIIDFTHSYAPFTNLYLSASVAGEITDSYTTKMVGIALPENKIFINIIDLIKFGSIIGGGGGAGSFIPFMGLIAPLDETINGVKLLGFSDEMQSIVFNFKLPSGYVSGSQLVLTGGSFFTEAITGNLLMQATTTLYKVGVTNLNDNTNQYISTNTEVLAPDTSFNYGELSNIDLTNSSGEINGLLVEENDIIKIEIKRSLTVTVPLEDIVYIPVHCFEPKKVLN